MKKKKKKEKSKRSGEEKNRELRAFRFESLCKNRANGCGSYKGSNQLCIIFWENFSKKYFIDPKKNNFFLPPFVLQPGLWW